MRKQSKPDYNKQVKVLTKHFKNLDQHYVRLIFQFCDFEAVSAYKVLQVLKDLQSPALIIKKLVDFPNQSDKIMKQLEAQFSKKYEQVKPQILSLLTEQNGSEIQRSNLTMEPRFNFFQFIPKDVCATIISYLDPFSFSKISQTNKKFYNISNSDALHFYFKNLSLRLFKNQQPQLPGECRFSEIKKYVQEHANQYGPNIRNAVLNNLRYYVWKTEPKSFKIQTSYYKSFGNFRNLYLQAPRVHFNGAYVCKHKYVKLGQKGFKFNITPLHVCYYYRYIRFFPDGSLLCFVTSNKVRKQQIAHLLSNQNLTNFDPHNTQELKIGEYMQFKNRLYMKIVKSNTVFSYEMQISSNMNKISDELMVISYNLEMVDQKEIIQKLYEYKPLKDRIVFNYLRNTIIEEENSAESKAISL